MELDMYLNSVSENKSDSVIVMEYKDAGNPRKLPPEELLQGEICAETVELGRFSVRRAQRIYKKTGDYKKECPASPEECEEFIKSNRYALMGTGDFYISDDVSYRLKDDPDPSYKFICRAAGARTLRWAEKITQICTVKEHISTPDSEAHLVVCVAWQGSSHMAWTWYKVSPDGKIDKVWTNTLSDREACFK